ncbi:hypothetical protein EVAR_62429_1 [Eumeta japonica]|uniref:Uncharacterized protein n=1 Tax=Eumeta variegata TaxID=151549 RepID=A0A4C1Z9X1_EUMVA|nr:hypothetical protein EVAR_62429_1 [Eumeta japonica]
MPEERRRRGKLNLCKASGGFQRKQSYKCDYKRQPLDTEARGHARDAIQTRFLADRSQSQCLKEGSRSEGHNRGGVQVLVWIRNDGSVELHEYQLPAGAGIRATFV